MKIVKSNQTLYQHQEEYEYTPTPAEMHYYYSGTNAGLDRNNPYAPNHGLSVTRHRYVLAKQGAEE